MTEDEKEILKQSPMSALIPSATIAKKNAADESRKLYNKTRENFEKASMEEKMDLIHDPFDFFEKSTEEIKKLNKIIAEQKLEIRTKDLMIKTLVQAIDDASKILKV